ncbi:MAG: glycosyltransferase [Candidatus Omnitrophota bacterium]|nr:glycosyltransferase [Candidatus Omnitrophota bacterium]
MYTDIGKISVLIPAYNEGNCIIENVEEIIRTFNKFGCKYEIVLIDDGSADATYEKMLELSKKFSCIRVKKNNINLGKGETLKRGFADTTGDLVVFLDVDLELHPRQLGAFFDAIKKDNADVVIGSKHHPDSKLKYPLYRRFLSSIYYFAVKIMFGLPVRDTQTGLKLFKREVLERVFPRILVKEYAYDLEILVLSHHFGYKIIEEPIILDYKRKWIRIGFRCLYKTFLDTLAIFYRMYILRYYDIELSNPPRDNET